MKLSTTLLAVNDIEASKQFYTEIMDQKILMDVGANVAFEGGFALQSRETWLEFIKKNDKDVLRKANNVELYFETREFETFLKKLRDHGTIELLHDVQEYPWGQNVIRFYDPDDHIIEVAESMEFVIQRFLNNGKSVQETADVTMYPVEFIQAISDDMK